VAGGPPPGGDGASPPARASDNQVDPNGIPSVRAKDMATGKDQRVTITASGGPNAPDDEQKKPEAEWKRATAIGNHKARKQAIRMWAGIVLMGIFLPRSMSWSKS
jgi:molecular chaperone DnaK (HSP70)